MISQEILILIFIIFLKTYNDICSLVKHHICITPLHYCRVNGRIIFVSIANILKSLKFFA